MKGKLLKVENEWTVKWDGVQEDNIYSNLQYDLTVHPDTDTSSFIEGQDVDFYPIVDGNINMVRQFAKIKEVLTKNSLDKKYKDLCKHILENGVEKKDRTGTGTLSIFGWQIRHDMSEGFPLLTTKKMAFKSIVTELLWFLRGDTNIKYLVDNDCHIWDGDAYKAYEKDYEKDNSIGLSLLVKTIDGLPSYTKPTKEEFIELIKADNEFAKKWGDLGPIYGKQWRSWTKKEFRSLNDGHFGYTYDDKPIDQIKNLINELKTNPDSRRLMVNSWNVGELSEMVLPPCHYGFQVYTRELSFEERLRLVNYDKEKFNSIDEWITWYKNEPNEFYYMGINYTKDTALTDLGVPTRAISLMWNQRSCDLPLGLPFNIASYGLLLMMIADEVNMIPEDLIGNLGDCHIYNNQIDGIKEQILRYPYDLPTVHVIDGIFCSSINDVILENYKSHPSIKMPLSN